jgi:hypothetical protein
LTVAHIAVTDATASDFSGPLRGLVGDDRVAVGAMIGNPAM